MMLAATKEWILRFIRGAGLGLRISNCLLACGFLGVSLIAWKTKPTNRFGGVERLPLHLGLLHSKLVLMLLSTYDSVSIDQSLRSHKEMTWQGDCTCGI